DSATAPGLGTARDRTPGNRISTPPALLFWLRCNHLWSVAAWSSHQSGRTTPSGPDGAAHGLLSAEQTAGRLVFGASPRPALLTGVGGQAAKAGHGGSPR